MTDASGEKVIRTVCRLVDAETCGIWAHVKDGVLVKIEPADFPDPGFRHICAKGLAGMKLVYHPDRLKYPLKRVGQRGEGNWERISWDEAVDAVAVRLQEIREKYGSESLALAMGGGTMWVAGMVYRRFINALEGTLVSTLGYGDSAGPCGDKVSFGPDKLFPELYTIDFYSPALCVVWGENPTDTQPVKWRRIRRFKERGAKVVVIDPRFTNTASKADQYISIRPGTDTALVLGMMNIILENGLYDTSFITKHTVGPFLVRSDNGLFLRERDIVSGGSDRYIIWNSKSDRLQTYDTAEALPALTGSYTVAGIGCKPAFQLLAELAAQYPVELVSQITEIDGDTIRGLAVEYATRKPVASVRGWGLQRTFHGDLTYRAIATLAGITGNISLEGGRCFVLNQALTQIEGKSSRAMPLLELYEALLTDRPYPIRALFIAGHNFVNQNPNMNKVINELLPRLEFIVVVDVFMNPTAQYADIVLPACTGFEYIDVCMPGQSFYHPFLQLAQKVIEPLYESKPDFDIVTELARRMGLGQYFDMSLEQFLEEMLRSGHPSVEGASLERLKQGPFRMPPHTVPAFTTPSGRFEFYVEQLKAFGEELPVYKEPLESARQPLANKYPLCYFSTHTKYGMHSNFANLSWMRELDPEPVLDINPVDAEKRGIKDGDSVIAFNDRGRLKLKARVHEGIRPGVVNIRQGWWPIHFAEGSHQALTHNTINPAQQFVFEPNAALYDVLVEVQRAEG